MKRYLAGVATVLYVLVGWHAFDVIYDREELTGIPHSAGAAVMGALWPFEVVMMGTVVAMGGGAGIFDSAYHYQEPKP